MALTEICSPTVYVNNTRPITLVPTRPIIFWCTVQVYELRWSSTILYLINKNKPMKVNNNNICQCLFWRQCSLQIDTDFYQIHKLNNSFRSTFICISCDLELQQLWNELGNKTYEMHMRFFDLPQFPAHKWFALRNLANLTWEHIQICIYFFLSL